MTEPLISDAELLELRRTCIRYHQFLTDWEQRFLHDTETRPAKVWSGRMIAKLRAMVESAEKRASQTTIIENPGTPVSRPLGARSRKALIALLFLLPIEPTGIPITPPVRSAADEIRISFNFLHPFKVEDFRQAGKDSVTIDYRRIRRQISQRITP